MKSAGTRHSAITAGLILSVVVPLICLVPFVQKPFHMDDPPYLWTARQIHENPLDSYGFRANWFGIEQPMYAIHKNPPLVAYFIAMAALVLGWSEVALHLAFLIPAVGVSVGTYFLAGKFCRRPWAASLTAVLTPVFLASSTNVMCDTLLVSFYVWAVALWVHGLEDEKPAWLLAASLCMALAALTKYFGISLVPLLLVYSLARRGELGRWSLFFLVPVAAVVGWEIATHVFYGTGLISDAVLYSSVIGPSRGLGFPSRLLTGLSFMGGCLASIAFLAPALWSRRMWPAAVLLWGLSAAVLLWLGIVGTFPLTDSSGIRWGAVAQLAFWIAAGAQVLILGAADIRAHRDPGSVLLVCWILGTFVFATFVNWTTTARSILPMAPAAGIVVARRLDLLMERMEIRSVRRALSALIPAGLLALGVTWADYSLAVCERSTAQELHERLKGYPQTIWFQGHWGFQYYMEAGGAKAVNFQHPVFTEGDLVVVPLKNYALESMPPDMFHLVAEPQCMPSPWVAIMEESAGAGFHSDMWGPLPFSIGGVQPDRYAVFVVATADRLPEAASKFMKLYLGSR